MTIDGVWIGNRSYFIHETCNYSQLFHGSAQYTIHYSTHKVFSICCDFTSCLVTTSIIVDFSASAFSGLCSRWLTAVLQNSALLRNGLNSGGCITSHAPAKSDYPSLENLGLPASELDFHSIDYGLT
jgi:hypothetical protein